MLFMCSSTYVCHICLIAVQLVFLIQAVGPLPITNDTLCYPFNVTDANGKHSFVIFNIDGRKNDWLEQCTSATQGLLRDAVQFICPQVSLGILRKDRPIIHQFVKRGEILRQVHDVNTLTPGSYEFFFHVREGDDLSQVFTDLQDACVHPAEYNRIVCTISRLALMHKDKDKDKDKDRDKEKEAEEEAEVPTLGDLMGIPSSVYWRHFAYSLPHRIQHNQTTTFYNHNYDHTNDGGDILRYGVAEALRSSLAKTLQRVETTATAADEEGEEDEEEDDERGTVVSPHPADNSHPSPQSSVTIAITTCKRFHFFLPTFMALQEILKLAEYDNEGEGSGHTTDPLAYGTGAYSIQEVLIVDDASSAADKLDMLTATQHCKTCTVVFKGLQEKGHAESMNLIIKMTSTRYLLYIEDDWLPLSKPLVPQSFLQPLLAVRHTSLDAAVSLWDFVSVAISILRKQGDAVCTDFDCLEDRSIVQVLLNDQTVRKCARYFDSPEVCTRLAEMNIMGRGGWLRSVVVQNTTSTPTTAAAASASLPYSLHEFAIKPPPLSECMQQRVHDFAFWPGFSLNPGVTDLHRLQALLRDSTRASGSASGERIACDGDRDSDVNRAREGDSCVSSSHTSGAPTLTLYDDDNDVDENASSSSSSSSHSNNNNNNRFDVEDSMFEHAFSLRAHASGASMAFLPLVVFQHAAANFESAYRLQGIERYWDNETIT